MLTMITFNPSIKLALSDVDETIADVYTKATPEMIHELSRFVEEGRALFLISGSGLQSIRERVVDLLKPGIRHIDFRNEDIAEIPEGHNIQLWDGEKRLHEGLLEYLQSRQTSSMLERYI